MKLRKLNRSEVEVTPYLLWNAFVDLLATESYEELASEQRPAHLAFWYESEVQNGGHLQYFENRRGAHLDESVLALESLGAICQAQVLKEAIRVWRNREREPIQTAAEFRDEALEGEFSLLDARFYECLPPLQERLADYLAQNQSSFVMVE